VRDHRRPAAVVAPPVAAVAVAPPAVMRAHLFLDAVAFKSITATAAPTQPPPPVGSPLDMTVLAYICKRVPLCPDPNPKLQWP
jgi:hypothetical protein